MNTFITSCKGESCQRSHECLRCFATDDHDVNRLCYSGFTFFKQNLPLPVFDEEDDD